MKNTIEAILIEEEDDGGGAIEEGRTDGDASMLAVSGIMQEFQADWAAPASPCSSPSPPLDLPPPAPASLNTKRERSKMLIRPVEAEGG